MVNADFAMLLMIISAVCGIGALVGLKIYILFKK
jgi:hypothetical protein